MSAPQALLGGRYRLVRRIAAGGMGIVWEGWDEVLERPVAVKQLRTEVGVSEAEAELAKNRAMREARITARLHHPHAVPVFDAVKHEGQPCLIMQYLPSTTLAAVLRERGPLPPAEAARIGAQIASALAAAHKLGIVHRDVKPGNILLTEDGNALISDFGISHALGDATLTSTGLVHGTPAYLAPEVARGATSGFPSDVFSLGSTLYAATEGAPPFGLDSNSIALLHKVAAGRFPPPVRSGALTPILLEMLDSDPESRPSMGDVAARLETLAQAARADERAGTVTMPLPPPVLPPPPTSSAGEEDPPSSTGEPASEEPEEAVPHDDLTLIARPDEDGEGAAAGDGGSGDVGSFDDGSFDDGAAGRAEETVPGSGEEGPAEEQGTGEQAPPPDAGTPVPESATRDAEGEATPTPAQAAVPSAAPQPTPPPGPRTVEPLPWFVADAHQRPSAPAPRGRAADQEAGERPGTPAPVAHAGGRERGRRLAAILTVAIVAAVALLGGSLLIGRLAERDLVGDSRPSATATPRESPSASAQPSVTPSATPSAAAPTEDPEATPVPPAATTPAPEPQPPPAATREEQLAQAVTSYYALMPDNTDAAWPLMTADYQTNHAGGRAAYQRFWDAVSEVSVSGVRGIAPDQVEAVVTYVYTDGSVVDELTAYRLVDEGGTLKIAATTVLSSVRR
ncbi:serine/threonine-protein kinase [Naasia sp. SYSU D00948]|uniref:serine/threonine-protein kinase n=1 Tax=Naasia sp. SYSU D00948 TaxID=2817379 RepID=UPI001B305074|nr:serine/threonine-protein kinase [Naasia sp. SYSU D00948]